MCIKKESIVFNKGLRANPSGNGSFRRHEKSVPSEKKSYFLRRFRLHRPRAVIPSIDIDPRRPV